MVDLEVLLILDPGREMFFRGLTLKPKSKWGQEEREKGKEKGIEERETGRKGGDGGGGGGGGEEKGRG